MSRARPRTPGQVESLPIWAQRRIQELINAHAQGMAKLHAIEQAHAVLTEREWFTLPGPQFNQAERSRALYILNRDDALRVCTLGPGDVLLIGRAKQE